MNRSLSFLMLYIGLMSTSQAGIIQQQVKWNAEVGNGHTYVLVAYENRSWAEATIDLFEAVGPGYHLATITSQAEQEFIDNSLFFGDETGEFWLGGYQFPIDTLERNKNWVWVTNEKWDYANWMAGEPNDYFGRGSEQHLGLLHSPTNSTWNDEANPVNIVGYIAESVPEPSSIILLAMGLAGLSMTNLKRNRGEG